MAAAGSGFSPVRTETIGRAVEALLKWINSKAKNQKGQLLDHDDLIYLVFTLKKIPTNPRTNPYKIPIPHPLYPLDSSPPFEICLIIDDRSKSSLTSDFAKKKIQSDSIPISKVLKLSKLRSDYRPFEAKRQLCSSYDLFFADKRVVPVLPRLLGKQFFKKKKIPIPINLQHKNWKEQIENACGSSLLYLRTGTCCILKVGKPSMAREEIVENVVAALAGAVEIVPKKWGNVRSLHLKSLDSVALPIYQTVPESGLKIEVFRKEEEVVWKPKPEVRKEKESDKKKKKKVSKKGRIHEVRYMDSNIDESMENLVDDGDDSKGDTAETLGEEKKISKKKKKVVAKELNGGDDGLTTIVVSGDGDDMDGGEANGDRSENMGKKKKNKKKKTTAMQEEGDAELNGGGSEIMDKKKKKAIAMEEMCASELNGGDAEIIDKKKKKNKKKEISMEEMGANELNGGDAETMDEKKKNKKEKAMAMEEMDGGTLKKLMKVKKGQNMEVSDGFLGTVESKKRMKGSRLEEKEKEARLEEKEKEARKKATKRRREIE